jgi:hypothetical protein
VDTAAKDASTSGFHLGLAICGALMILGGILAGIGIENPRRRAEVFPSRGSAQAGECGRCPDGDRQAEAGEHLPGAEAPTPA